MLAVAKSARTCLPPLTPFCNDSGTMAMVDGQEKDAITTYSMHVSFCSNVFEVITDTDPISGLGQISGIDEEET